MRKIKEKGRVKKQWITEEKEIVKSGEGWRYERDGVKSYWKRWRRIKKKRWRDIRNEKKKQYEKKK